MGVLFLVFLSLFLSIETVAREGSMARSRLPASRVSQKEKRTPTFIGEKRTPTFISQDIYGCPFFLSGPEPWECAGTLRWRTAVQRRKKEKKGHPLLSVKIFMGVPFFTSVKIFMGVLFSRHKKSRKKDTHFYQSTYLWVSFFS